MSTPLSPSEILLAEEERARWLASRVMGKTRGCFLRSLLAVVALTLVLFGVFAVLHRPCQAIGGARMVLELALVLWGLDFLGLCYLIRLIHGPWMEAFHDHVTARIRIMRLEASLVDRNDWAD